MKKLAASTLGWLALICASPESLLAGPNANAKILLHVAHVDLGRCFASNGRPPCGAVVTSAQLYPRVYDIALLVTDATVVDGVGGLECGIAYDTTPASGVDVFSWLKCADFEAPVVGPDGPWPASGSGNVLSWNTAIHCQRYQPAGTTVVALAGYFYCTAYTAGNLGITTSPGSHLALVASCAAVVDTVEGGFIHRTPSHLGMVRFSATGAEPGYNPCGLVTPVQNTTWSAIKGQVSAPR